MDKLIKMVKTDCVSTIHNDNVDAGDIDGDGNGNERKLS